MHNTEKGLWQPDFSGLTEAEAEMSQLIHA
jgi:hypothetical protein